MRFFQLAAFAVGASAGTVSVPFIRRTHPHETALSLAKRDGSLNLAALNNITGGGYYAEFAVGSPPQNISFQLDTGSSDTWVNSVKSDLCTSESAQSRIGFCLTQFDPEESSTFTMVDKNGFDIAYLDGRKISGSYFNDTVTIGDIIIENQQLGLALSSVRPTGIMGLGFSSSVAAASPYSAIVDSMKSQGLISASAFSLYLDDLESSTGSILFGGVDSEKFIGDMVTLPLTTGLQSVADNTTSFAVQIDGIDVSGDKDIQLGSFSGTALLDSGSTVTLLPRSLATPLINLFNVQTIAGLQVSFVDCKLRTSFPGNTINFQFGKKTIKVPFHELVIDSFGEYRDLFLKDPTLSQYFQDWDGVCLFGVDSIGTYGVSGDFALLGDTFLRSAYVVYDMDNQQIGLAQANLESNSSNIVAFDAKSGDIPILTGVSEAEGNDGTEGNGNSAGVRLSSSLGLISLVAAAMILGF